MLTEQDIKQMDTMDTMLEEAKAKKLWLYHPYQSLWFSPDELKQHWQNQRFRWVVGWQLRDPGERVREIDQQIGALEEERLRFVK